MYISVFKDRERGFTLLEVMIALSILSVGLIALASLATSNIKSTNMARRTTQALNIATEKIETLKAIPASSLQHTGTNGGVTRTCSGAVPSFTCTPSPATVTVEGNMDFLWTWNVTYLDLDGDGLFTKLGAADPTQIDSGDVKKVDVIVEWRDLYGQHSLILSSIRSRI